MATLMFLAANGQSYGSSPLLSTLNFDEHDLLFLTPSALFTEMGAQQRVAEDTVDSAASRMATLVEWVGRGHTLIVFGVEPLPFKCLAHSGNRIFDASIEDFPPLNAIKLTRKSGSRIETSNDKVISELFSPVAGLLNYSVVMEGQRLVPLLLVQPAVKTTTSAAVVGGYVRIGDGLVVFVPAGQGPGQPYWLALAQLPSLLRRDKPEFPEWVDKFQTAAEVTAFDNIAAQKEQIKRLQAETAKLEIQTSDGRRLKQLFVGSGSNFEDAVAEALRELGLSVVPGPHPRADLLATDGKRIAAIEAKGIDGASREEHVRQVMMWMPDVDAAMSTALSGQIGDVDLGRYVEQLKLLPTDQLDRSSDCKGILVIGTFRKLPLDQRAQQPDFPENVVRVIARQDVCALTGLQLYGLVTICRADPSLKSEVVKGLFDTRGQLKLATDWKQFLTERSMAT